jgi:hypothetical protein
LGGRGAARAGRPEVGAVSVSAVSGWRTPAAAGAAA